MCDSDSPRSSSLPPGYDEEDPYDGEEISTYPRWWRRNIEEFREHEMRPYRPPRFADGELVPEYITDLEEELHVTIRCRVLDPQNDNSWELLVDGERVATLNRRRKEEGYTQYTITSEEFGRVVRSTVNQ